MAVFSLKYRDTRPILQVQLLNPNKSVVDLAGSTTYKLHIWLADGSKLVRDMVKVGADADGTLSYTWLASDWDAVSGGGTVGGLVAGPTLPLAQGQREHRMEYEVIGATSRLTFPNDGYDTLRILADIGQG